MNDAAACLTTLVLYTAVEMVAVGLKWLRTINDGLKHSPLVEFLEYAGRFAVVVAVIFWFWESGERTKERHYRAWDLINSARGSTGDGGRRDALQDLNKDGVSLAAAPLEHAYLLQVDLKGAYLDSANLQGAYLFEANLEDADLFGANLEDAQLQSVNLQGARLERANLQRASLLRAKLQGPIFMRLICKGASFRTQT